MKLDTRAAVAALDATVRLAGDLPPAFAVSTDTRTLEPGDAFVALRGERYDGHAFLADAISNGASLLIVDDSASAATSGVPVLTVADTTEAYLTLGALARRQSCARFVAVTGSTGKTTTKTFLAQMLEAVAPGAVSATMANENNEIGVAKTLLAIPEGATYAVLELGARHYGEIAPLARAVRPDVAVLTNVGDAHLEIMGSRERLAETKWGVFTTGARAVLNLSDETSCAFAPRLSRRPLWFGVDGEGTHEADARERIVLHGRREVEACTGAHSRRLPCRLIVPGEHNRRNAAGALAAAYGLGVPLQDCAAALSELVLPAGRYERRPLSGYGCEAIYDAYNASMGGTIATLCSFAKEPAARRVAVLGSMAELGADAAAMHASVGIAAAGAGLEALLVGGEFAGELARGAISAGYDRSRIIPFCENATAADWLRANLQPGDLVLFKGSRRYKLEEILSQLESSGRVVQPRPARNETERPRDTAPTTSLSRREPLVVGRSDPRLRRPPFAYATAAIPVRTRLVLAHDDLPEVIAGAVAGIAGTDDVIAVSETAVAIAQNRLVSAERIRPSRLAYVLSRRARALATVNQPESLQLVIDEAGVARVVVAALAHAVGRVLRRRGIFYRVLGKSVATIDGYTGTLPPFERTIVLGPLEPERVAARIAARCNAHAVVVDANDLGGVNVLGASPDVDRMRVAAALRANPHGNGDEQTPIVVLAWRGNGQSPFLSAAPRPGGLARDTGGKRAA